MSRKKKVIEETLTMQEVTPEVNLENNSEYVNRDIGKSVEQLILENINFAYSVVHKEYAKFPTQIKEDLLSAAKEGLVYAASKYNNKQNNNNFISYAVNWIRYYIQEELRKTSPIKLNQNFVTKRNKILNFISEYKKEYDGVEPDAFIIARATGYSEKVVNNVLNINCGDNYSFISFNAIMNNNSSKLDDDGTQLENKLVNEYLEESCVDQGMLSVEVNDLLNMLKKNVSKLDYDIFIDKYLNDLSISDIAKKYKLPFPASAKYRLKCVEKVCKDLVG